MSRLSVAAWTRGCQWRLGHLPQPPTAGPGPPWPCVPSDLLLNLIDVRKTCRARGPARAQEEMRRVTVKHLEGATCHASHSSVLCGVAPVPATCGRKNVQRTLPGSLSLGRQRPRDAQICSLSLSSCSLIQRLCRVQIGGHTLMWEGAWAQACPLPPCPGTCRAWHPRPRVYSRSGGRAHRVVSGHVSCVVPRRGPAMPCLPVGCGLALVGVSSGLSECHRKRARC